MAHRVSDVRNVTLIGHSHSGKTSVVDALAFLTKTTPRHGLVGDGSSISNNEPEEKDRKHTLTSHIFHFPWKDRFLQVIDTPGHPDFLADTFSSFRAVETAVLVVSATSGATFHARRLFTEAEQAGLARAIVVTHMDAENTDFQALLASLVAIYGDKVVPVTCPDASAKAFTQVRSVMKGEGPDAKTWRASLEERVAETDDKLLEKYFEAGSLTEQELEDNVTKAMAHGTLIPLFVMQPDRELGVEEFLDFVAREFPSPGALGPRLADGVG
jgi:elongation factor G